MKVKKIKFQRITLFFLQDSNHLISGNEENEKYEIVKNIIRGLTSTCNILRTNLLMKHPRHSIRTTLLPRRFKY